MWRNSAANTTNNEEASHSTPKSTPSSLGPATPAGGAGGAILAPLPISLDQKVGQQGKLQQLERASSSAQASTIAATDEDDEAQHWLKPQQQQQQKQTMVASASAAAVEAYHKSMAQNISQTKAFSPQDVTKSIDDDEAEGIALANRLWGNEARRLILTNGQPVATP